MHKRDVSAVSGGKNSSLGRFISHMKRVNSWGVLTGHKPETKEEALAEIPEMIQVSTDENSTESKQ